jgi:hypothetical protein
MGNEIHSIKVVSIDEHEDGSATLDLELDKETFAQIFNMGFLELVRRGLEAEENEE